MLAPHSFADAMPKPVYHSQIGQDRLLDTVVFRGMEGGVVLDIGAHDGTTFSNSLAFERDRGWRAVCVEPNPAVFATLAATRPNATCLNVAVGDRVGTLPFTQVAGAPEMMSCLADAATPAHRERIAAEVARHGGTVRTIEVPVTTLGALLAETGLSEIHLLSIDTEGSEATILEELKRLDARVHVVDAECNGAGDLPRLRAALGADFALVGRHRHDVFFIDRGSPFIRRAGALRRALLAERLGRAVAKLGRRARTGRSAGRTRPAPGG